MQLEKFVNVTKSFQDQPLVYFESPYYNYSSVDMSLLRPSDCYQYTADLQGGTSIPPFKIKATFSSQNYSSLQSILGLSAYLWYFFLVFCIMSWIK